MSLAAPGGGTFSEAACAQSLIRVKSKETGVTGAQWVGVFL